MVPVGPGGSRWLPIGPDFRSGRRSYRELSGVWKKSERELPGVSGSKSNPDESGRRKRRCNFWPKTQSAISRNLLQLSAIFRSRFGSPWVEGGDLNLAATPLQARFYRGFGRYKAIFVADVCRYGWPAVGAASWPLRVCYSRYPTGFVDSGEAEVRLPMVDSQTDGNPASFGSVISGRK